MHGSADGSGKQTLKGRQRISEAVSKRMRAFWSDWRAKGKPTLPWADLLRTAKPRPKPPVPKKPVRKNIILTAEEVDFGPKIGLLK